jgi:hypothetical protein
MAQKVGYQVSCEIADIVSANTAADETNLFEMAAVGDFFLPEVTEESP